MGTRDCIQLLIRSCARSWKGVLSPPRRVSDSPSVPLAQRFLTRLRKAFLFFLLPVLVIAGGWEVFRYVKLHLALERAHRAFSQKHYEQAEFWTYRIFSADNRCVEGMRLMAEINEAQDRPAALGWRVKVAQRGPRTTEDIMAWAKCALRFGQVGMAATALNSLSPEFKNRSAEYQELMAGCALADHEPELAEAYFAKAAELDGNNPVNRVNLAAFRLTHSSNAEAHTAAARDLEGLLADSRVSLFAARALLGAAIRSGDHARAERFAEKLHSLPEHNFADDLSYLEGVISDQAFHPALEEIEHRAESNSARITETGDWLNAHGMAAEMLRWSARLAEPMRSDVPVQITAAESYLAMRDWNGLETFLAKRHWEGCDFLRRAMLIRCKRELSQPWENEWKQLVTEVETNPSDGLLLAQLATGWNWRNETINLLWDAAASPKTDSKALQYLWGIYSRTSDTLEMLRVAKAQVRLDPSNPTKKNNYAFLSLLMFGASENSERLAQEATDANPNVPEWAATYAYALHLAGKEAEARKVMEKLAPEALGRPGVALYYAIVLVANGDYPKARESLSKLNPNGMLPEERKLATDLAQQLNVASR